MFKDRYYCADDIYQAVSALNVCEQAEFDGPDAKYLKEKIQKARTMLMDISVNLDGQVLYIPGDDKTDRKMQLVQLEEV